MSKLTCESCGNVNHANGVKHNECVKCNWQHYGCWQGVLFSEAIESPDWRGFGWECPVCGNNNAGEHPAYDVCPVCEWEDDHLQRDNPDFCGGANDLSLNDFRREWEKKNVAQDGFEFKPL